VLAEMTFINGLMAQLLIAGRKRTYLSAKRNVVNTLSVPDLFLSKIRVVDIGSAQYLHFLQEQVEVATKK